MDISVIICTYNRCESLKDTLDSLELQENTEGFDYEIIVADNNSHDHTKEVVENYMPRFNGRLKYLFEPRQGKPFALNSAIKEAKGEIIVFIDDDCITDKAYLFNLYAYFKDGDKNIGIVGGRVMPLWLAKEVPSYLNSDFFMGPLGILDYGIKPFIAFSTNDNRKKFFAGNNFAIKRNLFEKFGYFDERMANAQDTEICYRFLKAGVEGLYNPELKVFHKIPADRIKPAYLYNWFYKRGKFWDYIKGYKDKYDAKPYHPMGIPFWVILKVLKEFSASFFVSQAENKIQHRCWGFYYLGKMVKLFKENIV